VEADVPLPLGDVGRIRTRLVDSGDPGQLRQELEAIYDDYAKANFTNYELRKEDLNQLAAFSRQFKDVNEFLASIR